MANDPTPNQTGQLCLGPDGHHPPFPVWSPNHRFRVFTVPGIQNNPRLHLRYVIARRGEPCIGIVTLPTKDVETPIGRIALIGSVQDQVISFHPEEVSFVYGAYPNDPIARQIIAYPDGRGGVDYEYRLDGLPPDEARWLQAAWTAEWERVENKAGRQLGATTYPRDLVREKLDQSHTLHRQGYTRPQRAARLGVPPATLRYWEKQREKDPKYPF